MAQVVADEIGAVGVVAVEAVHLAESVVQGGVEGTGGDQRAQRRDRLGQLQLRCVTSSAALMIFRLQDVGQVDRMARLSMQSAVRSRRSARPVPSWRPGCRRRTAFATGRTRRCPAASSRSRVPPCRASVRTTHVDVEEGGPVQGDAAELDRRAIEEILVASVTSSMRMSVGFGMRDLEGPNRPGTSPSAVRENSTCRGELLAVAFGIVVWWQCLRMRR